MLDKNKFLIKLKSFYTEQKSFLHQANIHFLSSIQFAPILNYKYFFVLGGTLGLFVGMSIMTFIEIIIWTLNLITKILLMAKRSRKTYRNRK